MATKHSSAGDRNFRTPARGIAVPIVIACALCIAAVIFLLMHRNAAPDDPLIRLLGSEIVVLQEKAGVRCANLADGIRRVVSNDIRPLLDQYKSTGTAGALSRESEARLVNMRELAGLCVRHQRAIAGWYARKGVQAPAYGTNISEKVADEFESIYAYVVIGLRHDPCDAGCVASQMRLLEPHVEGVLKATR